MKSQANHQWVILWKIHIERLWLCKLYRHWAVSGVFFVAQKANKSLCTAFLGIGATSKLQEHMQSLVQTQIELNDSSL